MQEKSLGYRIGRVLIFLVLFILAVSFVYPILFMFINSLKTLKEYYYSPFTLPDLSNLQWSNFGNMISQFKILGLLKNSFIVSLFTVIGLIGLGTLASYAFAKIKFPGSRALYLAFLVTLFVPAQVTMIPMYINFAKVGLVNNWLGVVIANWAMFLPETIMLMTANFKGIPDEIIEAATIDGCGFFGRLWNVVIPMGWPAISLTIIFFFINSWNDLFTPMIMLKSMDKRTVMVALNSLVGQFTGNPPYQFAGLVLAALPALLVYIFLQKSIVNGMSMGAIK
ncbi:MAG: carbohydrate ABC transporter permease [Eubacteriales bacterium]|nr:carbohydrate ABC transporter permease [Eubacteriales bacterium]